MIELSDVAGGVVVLRPLVASDAVEYAALLRSNAAHLGPDAADERSRSAGELAEAFADDVPPLRFAMHDDGRLIGRIDLVPVAPPRFGMGYWVDAAHTGRGIATAAVAAIVRYAAAALEASDVFAGVSHGNLASERVLEKNGFSRIESFATYDRFHRAVHSEPRT